MTEDDPPIGRSVGETLRLLRAFQFTEKPGKGPPVGWKPGNDTIKPATQKSKE